jgi:hypothetical protein
MIMMITVELISINGRQSNPINLRQGISVISCLLNPKGVYMYLVKSNGPSKRSVLN